MALKSDGNIGKNWERVKHRLRAELGEEVYSSWFGRVEPEGLNDGLLQLSVPTKFLQKWLESHYATTVLTTCKSELPEVSSLEFLLRGPNTMKNSANGLANIGVESQSAPAMGANGYQAKSRTPNTGGPGAPVTNAPSFRASRQKNDGSPLNPRRHSVPLSSLVPTVWPSPRQSRSPRACRLTNQNIIRYSSMPMLDAAKPISCRPLPGS